MVLFDEMGLNDPLLKAIKELGFQEPTPIQEKVIPKILKDKKDLVAQAQTGTGKTAAFGLPIIQMADVTNKDTQSLVLCPTRELCVQISSDLKKYSTYTDGLRIVPVYGGASIETQIRSLKKGGQIVVGTPGRVRDLINRKILKIKNIDWLVLDEADEMLNMGFKEELDAILESTPAGKQTFLFSATMPKAILRIANNYMHQPDEISVGTKHAGAENVKHEDYVAHARHRYEVLKRIADMNPQIYGIVFCRTRHETKEIADKFMSDGYNADALHGDLSQAQRDFVMNRFRNRNLQMLVATDVAARGLDVNDLTHVINYNLPDDLEVYIHRSGRTGRAGKSGTSISIIHTRENRKIRELEKIAKKPFTRKMIPGGKEICKKQLFNLVDKVEKVELNDGQIEEFLPEIYKKLEWLSREDLIKHFVSVEFNRFLSYYKNAPDLNVEVGGTHEKKNRAHEKNKAIETNKAYEKNKAFDKDKAQVRDRDNRRSKKGFTRFYINMGTKQNLTATRLIGLVNDNYRIRNIQIGKIDIMRKFSFFEIENQHERDVLNAFKGQVEFEGEKVILDISKPEPVKNNAREEFNKKKRPHKKKAKRRRHEKEYSIG
jgi:ATP-dependent RNA helicase DeaD